MSFNIHYGDRDRSLINIGRWCVGSDVICLQEVDQNTNRWFPSGSGDQFEKIRAQGNFHGHYFRTNRYPGAFGLGRGWMGQGVLSKWPIVAAQAFPGGNNDWPLSYARIDHPTYGPLHVFSEHFPLTRQWTLQLRHAAALASAIKTVTGEGGRVIVGADFNAGRDGERSPVNHLIAHAGLAWTFVPGRDSFPEGYPCAGGHASHIDHILVRGFASSRCEYMVGGCDYSDHPVLRTDLDAV